MKIFSCNIRGFGGSVKKSFFLSKLCNIEKFVTSSVSKNVGQSGCVELIQFSSLKCGRLVWVLFVVWVGLGVCGQGA